MMIISLPYLWHNQGYCHDTQLGSIKSIILTDSGVAHSGLLAKLHTYEITHPKHEAIKEALSLIRWRHKLLDESIRRRSLMWSPADWKAFKAEYQWLLRWDCGHCFGPISIQLLYPQQCGWPRGKRNRVITDAHRRPFNNCKVFLI